MKLKKFLLILLAAISCVCVGFAFGCKEDPAVDNPVNNECTVSFALSEHVKYVIDGEEKEEHQVKVDKETVLKFSVVVEEGFLADTLVVKDDAGPLVAVDGVYSYNVMNDATITATVAEDLLEVDENGVYLISSLKDLCFVADMVNSGYSNYVMGSYKLLNDIDCGGAQLDVIGYFEHPSAFFSGTFNGQNYTISNYTISTNGTTYAGLFGCVQLSTARTSVIIQNLNLKDFTINATASDDNSVCVGGIAAFTAGANVVACSAEGIINVYGSGYFSYAGGAVGIQQSLTITEVNNTLYHYHATTEYVRTKVTITADHGYISAAGGVVGYVISSHERAASMVLNSYAEGNVFGAMSSGGVVGRLDDYSSVANCYSTGFVNATVTFPEQVENRQYFAYAGGIVGYAGVETTISDSFTTGRTYAYAENVGMATGDIYAYASPATEFVYEVTVFNSYAGNDAKPTDVKFVKETLGWNEADWVIKGGAYPSTNFSQVDEVNFEITLNYLGNNTVKNAKTKVVPVQVKDQSYFSFSSYLETSIDESIVADAAGHTSFGFFFDEKCTQRVHYSFVPTRALTLYVGFADYSQIAGTYEFKQADRTIKLVLNTDTTFSYVDVMTFDGSYVYDGTKLTFNDALFARLSSNFTVDENDDPQLWLNYEPYKFVGTVSEGKLLVYDGVYFTDETIDGKDNRLAFTNAGTQSDTNGFIGTWERSATINEKYTFDESTWTYSWKGQSKSGGYTVNGGVATLTGDITATASIDNSGLLLVKETGKADKYFCLENSFYGNWYSSKGGDYLVLDGHGNGYAGSANAIIDGTVYDNLAYVKDGFFDTFTSNNPYTYTIISGYSLFGYFTYDTETRTITAMLYDQSSAGFLKFDFVLYDYYLGEWIGEEEVDNVPFTIMDFNGLGLYKAEGDATLGYVVIENNGVKTKVEYQCSVENGMNGSFSYGGTEYVLTTNGDGTVTVTAKEGGSTSANLYRKDVMASTPLVDKDDNVYEFNGGGLLSKGGILTKKSEKGVVVAEYRYKIISGSIDGTLDKNGNVVSGYDIIINLYDISSVDGDVIGTIEISYPKFVLKLNGQKEVSLDLHFGFAEKWWSISGLMNHFRIGKFDLTYRATGTYNGQNNVPFLYYPEYNYIYIYFRVDGDGFDSYYVENYLLLLDDDNLIVSSYPYFVSSDQWYYASPRDDIWGEWENTETGALLTFDGLADSKYTVGVARDSNGLEYFYTRRFGTLYLWLEDGENVLIAYTVIYDENDDELSGANVYRKPHTKFGGLVLTIVDDILGEPIKTATDNDGTNYEFNFDGTVKVGDKSGKYLIKSVDGNSTTVEITIDGKVITVEVSHDENGTATVVD